MYKIGRIKPMAECLERPCETGYDLLGTSAGIRQDLKQFVSWLGDLRVLLFGLIAVLLSVTLITALSGRGTDAMTLRSAATYSGDDLYDPAAGSVLALLSRSAGSARAVRYSGDDAYDPAAGARPERAFRSAGSAASFSGDDAYDLAAGSQPTLFANRARAVRYSGDDAYDPAAGAQPERAFRTTGSAASFSGDDAYDPAASRQPALFANRSRAVSYSGDDAYDPAAAGTQR
jgi:hypothetical protein